MIGAGHGNHRPAPDGFIDPRFGSGQRFLHRYPVVPGVDITPAVQAGSHELAGGRLEPAGCNVILAAPGELDRLARLFRQPGRVIDKIHLTDAAPAETPAQHGPVQPDTGSHQRQWLLQWP